MPSWCIWGLIWGWCARRADAGLMIVPTLCVGMQPGTLRVPKSVTQSVTRGVPTQSVGTIGTRSPVPCRRAPRAALHVRILEIRIMLARAAEVGVFQVAFAQLGLLQVGVAEVGALEIGLAQPGHLQIGGAQVGVVQPGPGQPR